MVIIRLRVGRVNARLLAPAIAAAAALMLAGCSGAAARPATGGTIQVVASTNVYGSIAEQIGGDRVQVTSLISRPSQDPHEFEASAIDQLAVGRADLVVDNGGGYDPFMDGLIKASGAKAPVVTAVSLSKAYAAGDDNEHVFYDPATMSALADAIAGKLGAIDPAHKAAFDANARAFGDGIRALEASIATIAHAHTGVAVFVTEPLPLYLTTAAGLENRTPAAFSDAVEAGQDVAPAVLLHALDLIAHKRVQLVVLNVQAPGSASDQVQRAAQRAGIPVLSFAELVPGGKTYLTWMRSNVDAIAHALG